MSNKKSFHIVNFKTKNVEKKSGIYIIIYTNPETNKKSYYIGSAKYLRSRFCSHLATLKKNKHSNSYLQNIYNKHGINVLKFLPIQIIDDVSILVDIEQKWLDTFILKGNNVLNINREKVYSGLGTKRSPEICKAMSIHRKKFVATEQGKNLLKENSNKAREVVIKETPVLININTGQFIEKYPSITEMAKDNKFNYTSIVQLLNKKIEQYKGFIVKDFWPNGYTKKAQQTKRITTPTVINTVTQQIIGPQYSIAELARVLNRKESSVRTFIHRETTRTGDWVLYNKEKSQSE